MKIELIGKRVTSLAMAPIEGKATAKKTMTAKVTLNNEIYSNVKDSKLFRVKYHVIVMVEDWFKIELNYEFDFKSEEDFSWEIVKSHEVRSVVPSIAYPYIKTYAEQLMVISNIGNFNLPYIDFFGNPMEPAGSDNS